MNSEAPLDYALFQLSPRRSRCELFVSGDGKTEKLASGLLKPFVSHLKVAEEQVAQPTQSIWLEVEQRENAAAWFNKGTLERFVRFVSTPEVLELVNTFDAEMSQLEGARRIYSLGTGDQISGALGVNAATTADVTKKELLRAIDLRLAAVKQDLTMACARASAAGFTLGNASELLLFSDRFGAHRLNEACTKFISLCQQRPELITRQHQSLQQSPSPQWRSFDNENLRSSSGSDMSIDEPEVKSTAKSSISDVDRPQHLNLRSNSQPALPEHAASVPPATSQQSRPISHHLTEKGVEKKVTEEPATSASQSKVGESASQSDVGESAGDGSGSRRLSLKDRIKFFESKQKEQSSGGNSILSGTGTNKGVSGKAELRRLPSDSSFEKSVLRRWSGVSDMSIDFSSNDNRRESGSAAGTPTSSASSQAQIGSRIEEKEAGLKDAGISQSWMVSKGNTTPKSSLSSSHVDVKVLSLDNDRIDDASRHTPAAIMQPTPASEEGGDLQNQNSALGDLQNQNSASVGREKQGSNQVAFQAQPKVFVDSCQGAGMMEEAASHTRLKAGSQKQDRVKGQTTFEIPPTTVPAFGEQIGQKSQKNLGFKPTNLPSGGDNTEPKDHPTSAAKFRTFPSKIENADVRPKSLSDSVQSKDSSGNFEGIIRITESRDPNSQWKMFTGKVEEVGNKKADSSSVQTKEEKEHSGLQGMRLHRQTSASEQKLHSRDLLGRKVDTTLPSENSVRDLTGRKTKESSETFESPTISSMEQVEMERPSKGNQQLNNELQMKADELERLFAAHKLRIHGDQKAPSRRSKPSEALADNVAKSVEKRPAESLPVPLPERNTTRDGLSNGVEFDATLLLKMVDNQDYVHSMKHKLGSPSEDYRGRLYENYMQKRDAKLKKDWGSNRAQKEAKMKAMNDSLERSQAEMKAKVAGSADKQNLGDVRRRAEKLRSFSAHTAKNKSQTIKSLEEEEEEDPRELPQQVHYGEDKSYSDAQYSDGSSRSSNSRKHLSSKTVSSAAPRISTTLIPRASVKATNSGSIKRRMQSENPLAQSVPNFSDLRKENTKPATGFSKITRAQSRNFSVSKGTTEETNLVKEEKPKRSQSIRKSIAGPRELKDVSPLKSDSANLTPLEFSEEQPEETVFNNINRSSVPKTFLRKGNDIGPGSGTGIAKQKGSIASEMQKNEEETEGLVDDPEDPFDVDKNDNSEKPYAERNLEITDFAAKSDNEKPRLSHESGNSDEQEFENDDILRSPSQADDGFSAMSLKFNNSTGNIHESPEESPGYWNSHVHHSFSYGQETSDVDASVDSPSGSPVSWNSQPLNQIMEADAARMRKKWGSAQIPVLVANASHQPRKDVTKGFKRLLKFGRRSRGPESLVTDCVSASTASEGDDDIEDGRDLATRPSEDLRKSRMGYAHPAYDGFNMGEVFPEQVQALRSSIPTPPANFKLRDDHLSGSSLKAPRSFFSLSTFRSKGSESKLR